MDLKEIIASLWQGEMSGGKYLGCGVFITPTHILTAHHVVEKLTNNPGDIYTGPLPGGRASGLPLVEITKHLDRDVAILTTEWEHSGQTITCDLAPPLKEGSKIYLVAFNRQEKCTKGPIEVGLNNRTSPDGWEFHTQPVPGMSGGAVIFNGQLAGIIQANDSSENSGFVIPLNAIESLLKSFLSEKSVLERSNKQRLTSNIPKEDGTFRKTLLRNIVRELCLEEAKSFLDGLLVEFNINEPDRKKARFELANQLLDEDTNLAIQDYITNVTEKCIHPGKPRYQENKDKIPAIKRIAEEIIGWLVLSSVNEDEINSILPKGSNGNSLYFVLGLDTTGGVELVLSRRFHRKSKWLGKESATQRSPNHIKIDPRYFGENEDQTVNKIMIQIWNKVMDGVLERPKDETDTLTPEEVKTLNATLKLRRTKKDSADHYYITFSTGTVSENETKHLYNKLLASNNLCQMTVVEFGSEHGNKALIIDEYDVLAAINDFYRSIHKQETTEEQTN